MFNVNEARACHYAVEKETAGGNEVADERERMPYTAVSLRTEGQ